MTKFSRATPQEQFDQTLIEQAIPGEALTIQPGRFPYERPAQFTNPTEAFDALVAKVLEPINFNAIAAVLDAGFPLDTFVTAWVKQLYTEGVLDPRIIPIVTIPMTVMFIRMCESLKIDFNLSVDTNQAQKVSETEVMARLYKEQQKVANGSAKATRAMKDVKRMMNKEGLMARPEAFV